MKCLKVVICVLVLFATCSCGAKFFAEESSLELYNPNGSLAAKVFSNKGYDGFNANATFANNKLTGINWTAQKVNSDTVAIESLKAVQTLSGTVKELATGAGAIMGIPIQ